MSNNETYYGYSKEVHEFAERLIAQEISANQTLLVNALQEMFDYENNVLAREFCSDNYHNPYSCEYQWLIENCERYEITDWLDSEGIEYCKKDPIEKLVLLIEDPYDIQVDNYWEQPQQEVFEWWLVSEWLGNHLLELGEPILKNAYGIWWGRTCTGQAIILDGTFQQLILGPLNIE